MKRTQTEFKPSMTKAPKNEFRVIVENTMFNEKHKVSDYPTLKRATMAAKAINSKLQRTYIFNDKGICISYE